MNSADLTIFRSSKQWSPCCNDTILSNNNWELIQNSTTKCKPKNLDNYDKFIVCFLLNLPTFCRSDLGFNIKVLERLFGGPGLNIANSLDWKAGLNNTLLWECFFESENTGTFSCSADTWSFMNCYWRKAFSCCPASLKNEKECEKLFGVKV